MSDQSLMNPDHLKSEIHDMEELVAKDESIQKEMKEDYERMIDMIRESHDAGQDSVLTPDQVRDLIETLSKFNHTLYVYSRVRAFHLRVYKHLMRDRRWFIAAKYLKFFKK